MNIYQLMPAVSELIPYDYAKIRCAEYDRLIAYYLSTMPRQRQPMFAQIGGIPGSGKSTFCQRFYPQKVLSFDAIMESIPAYQQDLYLLGNAAAFKKWELPARIIGYEILSRAVSERRNIIMEHSGVNPAHVQLFEHLKKLGYTTQMYFILCALPVAVERTQEREKITHRHTPQAMIEQRFGLVNDYLPQYQKIADSTFLYDTSYGKFVLQQSVL